MATGINTALQLMRVIAGAQQMDHLDPEERNKIILMSYFVIPLLAAPVLYFLFVLSTRSVEYLGDKFFPEQPTTTSSSKTPKSASKRGSRSPASKKKKQ